MDSLQIVTMLLSGRDGTGVAHSARPKSATLPMLEAAPVLQRSRHAVAAALQWAANVVAPQPLGHPSDARAVG
jgi:hypothetical protein